MSIHDKLADLLMNDPEAMTCDSQALMEELTSLRREKERSDERSHVQQQLQETNEHLLHQTRTKLNDRMAELQQANEELSDSRRAALNVMEDAIRSSEALRESEARIAADLVGMRRLYELNAKLAVESDLLAALDAILLVMVGFAYTERGCIQLLTDDGRMEMVAHCGYAPGSPFTEYFRYTGSQVACEIAKTERRRIIIEDVETFEPLAGTKDREVGLLSGIRATQSTPIITRQGEAIGILITQYRQPRCPDEEDLKLMDLLAWTAGSFIEKHRADTALGASEAKYRSLFESIDEGYALCELIYDDTGKAIDWRLLEVNPAFERLTGFADAAGKTAAKLDQTLNSDWLETFNNVAQTGEPARFEHYIESVDYWFDLHASRLDGDTRHLIIVFNNITDRKRREANLAFLAQIAEDSSRLASEAAIMQSIGSRLAKYLRLDGFNFADVDERRESVTIKYSWNAADVPQLLGTFRFADYMTEESTRTMRAGETWVVCQGKRTQIYTKHLSGILE